MNNPRKSLYSVLIILSSLFSSGVLAYDPDVSFNAVMYSAATYCKISDILKWDCGRPCKLRRGMKNVMKV
jgi:hypothetical protein